MKIPEWLPDTQRPVRVEQQPRKALIEPWMRPLVRFLHIEAAGGFVLLVCTVLALIVANCSIPRSPRAFSVSLGVYGLLRQAGNPRSHQSAKSPWLAPLIALLSLATTRPPALATWIRASR